MPNAQNVASVAEIKDRLSRAQAMIVAEYRGLNAKEVTALRQQTRDAGVDFKVLKNTLTSRAAHELNIEGLDSYLEGPNAYAFGYDDPVSGARVLAEFAKTHNKLVIKCGVLDGQVIDADAVKYLADLPSREVLLAQVLRGMQAPISGLVNVLQGTIRSLVYTLEAVRQQKEESAGA